MFTLICNGWVNNHEAGDLRRHRAHSDVIVMVCPGVLLWWILTASKATQHSIAHSLSYIEASNPHVSPLRCPGALHWRHNDHDGVSNHQPHGCLLNRSFRRRSKKTSKLCVTGLCVGNSPGPVNSPHKGPVTRKMSPFDDVIMSKAIQHSIAHSLSYIEASNPHVSSLRCPRVQLP